VADICREMGINKQTFYNSNKKFDGMETQCSLCAFSPCPPWLAFFETTERTEKNHTECTEG